MSNNIEKLIIIGSGPAALTAAIYAARAHLNPLIIEGTNPGGQLMGTTYVENWPGEISILGPALMLEMRKHAAHFGTRFISEEVCHVNFGDSPFAVQTTKNTVLQSYAIIIATGATPKRLNCLGEDEYWGKGVTSCAVCDGAFYQGKQVIVVGGGDSAMETALFMTNFTDHIILVHILPNLTASQAMQQKVLHDSRITIIYNSTVTQIMGNGQQVDAVIIINVHTQEQVTMDARAVFIAIGLNPNTSIFKHKLELDSYGYIKLKEHTHTSVPGVFAAGDVADFRYRQAITSAGTGCAAALDAEKYLHEKLCLVE